MKIKLGIWRRKAPGTASGKAGVPLNAGLIETLAHDMNNIIMIIKGYLDLVRPENINFSDTAKEGLDIATRATDSLAGMISDLVDVAQMEEGRLPLHIKNTDADGLASEVVEGAEKLASEAGVELVKEGPEGPIWCDMDKEFISRALANLIGNAIRFTPSGGRVIVSVASDEARAKMTVCDTGYPIAPQYREKIFEKEAQTELKRANARRGFGVGLIFSKMVACAHGGDLRAEQEDGRSAFIMTIPKRQP